MTEAQHDPRIVLDPPRQAGPVAILLRPRAAVRAHIEAGLWWPSAVIFAASGAMTGMMYAVTREVILGGVLVGTVLVAPAFVALGLVFSVAFRWLGRAMGGTGTARDLFIATGLAVVPQVLLQAVGLIGAVTLGDTSPPLAVFLIVGGVVMLLVGWRLAACIGEAHGFGFWRGLAVLAIVYFVFAPLSIALRALSGGGPEL